MTLCAWLLLGYAARDSLAGICTTSVQSALSAPLDADALSGMRTFPPTLRSGVCSFQKHIKRKNTAIAVFLYGAPSGIRTRDPLIKSQLLYQLS